MSSLEEMALRLFNHEHPDANPHLLLMCSCPNHQEES